MKKRNPIARVVTKIPPKVIPDKRHKMNKPTIDIEEDLLDDERANGEIIAGIRDSLINIDVQLSILHRDLDILRDRIDCNANYKLGT